MDGGAEDEEVWVKNEESYTADVVKILDGKTCAITFIGEHLSFIVPIS